MAKSDAAMLADAIRAYKAARAQLEKVAMDVELGDAEREEENTALADVDAMEAAMYAALRAYDLNHARRTGIVSITGSD